MYLSFQWNSQQNGSSSLNLTECALVRYVYFLLMFATPVGLYSTTGIQCSDIVSQHTKSSKLEYFSKANALSSLLSKRELI